MPQVVERLGFDVPYWIIAAGGKTDCTIKSWALDRWQAVVDHFRGRILFVQVGAANHCHPPLRDVVESSRLKCRYPLCRSRSKNWDVKRVLVVDSRQAQVKVPA